MCWSGVVLLGFCFSVEVFYFQVCFVFVGPCHGFCLCLGVLKILIACLVLLVFVRSCLCVYFDVFFCVGLMLLWVLAVWMLLASGVLLFRGL